MFWPLSIYCQEGVTSIREVTVALMTASEWVTRDHWPGPGKKNHFKFLVQKKGFIIKAWIIYFYDSNSGEWLRMWKVGRHFFIFTFFYYLFLLWKKVRDVLKGKEKKSVKKPSLLFLIKKKKKEKKIIKKRGIWTMCSFKTSTWECTANPNYQFINCSQTGVKNPFSSHILIIYRDCN